MKQNNVDMKKRNKYLILKRMLDIIFSSLMLIVLSPLFLVVAIIIKMDSKGPVFFKQIRSGKDDKNFNMYKFRSMAFDNDVLNFNEKDKTTRVGKILRKTSVDELPQIINILKGEMSFIGPRPWIVEYSKYFTKKQKKRLNVLPGITGLAQAEGRNGLSIGEKINYDIKYVEELSLKMDIYVIYKTIKTVFTGKDASANKGIIQNELEELKSQFKSNSTRKIVRKPIEENKIESYDKIYEESII